MIAKEETIILQIINEKKLIRKSELEKLIKDVEGVSPAMVNGLIEKGLVSDLSPLGETSFILTQEGIKALREEA